MRLPGRARVLCVDDEPRVLDALVRGLRPHYAIETAIGGEAGLAKLQADAPFAAVISDLKMPGLDGIAFLERARTVAPDTVRLLLTGHADLDAAIAAVNQSNIFRFLCKPCPGEALLRAVADAVAQHRLITAERELLEMTLHGSICALTEVLGLVNPTALGRATRAKRRVGELATRCAVPDRWQVEIAAMLSQVGCLGLPASTTEKLFQGRRLTDSEASMAARMPIVAAKVLRKIPRLENVCEILACQDVAFDGGGASLPTMRGDAIPWGARALKIVLDFDSLEMQGLAPGSALDTLALRAGAYDPRLLSTFREVIAHELQDTEVQAIPLADLKLGMLLAEDLVTTTDLLLITRGQEMTPGLMERIRAIPPALVREPIRVFTL